MNDNTLAGFIVDIDIRKVPAISYAQKILLETSKIILDCNQSVFFKKKSDFFMLTIEQSNSNQSSLMSGPNAFSNRSQIMYLIYLLISLWSF